MAHGAAHASSDSLCRFDRPGAPLRALYPPSCVDEGLARSKGVGEHVPARHHLPHPHVQRVEGGGALVECVNERLHEGRAVDPPKSVERGANPTPVGVLDARGPTRPRGRGLADEKRYVLRVTHGEEVGRVDGGERDETPLGVNERDGLDQAGEQREELQPAAVEEGDRVVLEHQRPPPAGLQCLCPCLVIALQDAELAARQRAACGGVEPLDRRGGKGGPHHGIDDPQRGRAEGPEMGPCL
mmetsp:Transcript_17025/g.38201  ORF Transcript_17025/g.38201 Transcript_17025/m.38201 type:complete len:242 (-) Transcript_17025:1740-2465(-)